jgi:hypothetical protein
LLTFLRTKNFIKEFRKSELCREKCIDGMGEKARIDHWGFLDGDEG